MYMYPFGYAVDISGKGVSMRRYHPFTKPAKVADVLQEDNEASVSDLWQEKAELLQRRRWHKMRTEKLFFKKKKPWHNDTVAWDL